MKKNEVFQLKIEDMSGEGLGIGKLEGFVWFVKDTVIGDVVEAAAMKVKKNYGFARLVRILEPSEARIEAPCSIAKSCGGCQLQQLRYEAQLAFKSQKVYNNLHRLGGVEEELLDRAFEPIVGMKHPFRYRNKALFPISRKFQAEGKRMQAQPGQNRSAAVCTGEKPGSRGRITAGFYAGRTHSVIPCEDCLLGVEENREILARIIAWMEAHSIEPYSEAEHSGLVRHVLIRKGFQTGQMMVCLVINGKKLPCVDSLLETLCKTELTGEKSGKITSVSYSVNMEKTNVVMGAEIVNLYGPGYIEDYIGKIRFRISPLSFFQVNPVQTEVLYGTALEFAGLTGQENVWDLYCGIGSISLFLAQKARQVYGVEIIPQAIEDARQNAVENGIKNAEFYVGAAEDVLPDWYAAHPDERIDVVCVDPPRKGCDERCLETIVRMQPERIVYVSCDSATLARDVCYLRVQGYELRRVRAVDMFPGTVHVETVALLSKQKQRCTRVDY